MRKPVGYWTLELCKAEAAKHTTQKAWLRSPGGSFAAARRQGWTRECCEHMTATPSGYWTLERCKESAAQFATRNAWVKGGNVAYQIAHGRGWLDECCGHMVYLQAAPHSRTTAELNATAQKFKTRVDWRDADPKTYQYAQRTGRIDEFCDHMPVRACSTAQNLFAQRVRSVAPGDVEVREEIAGLLTNKRETLDIVAYRNGVPFFAVEYCGIYWHNENNTPQRLYNGVSIPQPMHHERRRLECAARDIRLVHLWEDVADDPRQFSVVQNALGCERPAVRASKCALREITNAGAATFLNANHPQGWAFANVNFGLFHSDRLVAVMSFKKSGDRHTGAGLYDWALHRFATDINLRVHGAASKLFAMRPAGRIVSYCDLDLFTGGVYAALGFDLVRINEPRYSWTKSEKRIPLYRAQKHLLPKLLGASFRADESEAENMRRCGWAKLWHTGMAVYAFPGNQ